MVWGSRRKVACHTLRFRATGTFSVRRISSDTPVDELTNLRVTNCPAAARPEPPMLGSLRSFTSSSRSHPVHKQTLLRHFVACRLRLWLNANRVDGAPLTIGARITRLLLPAEQSVDGGHHDHHTPPRKVPDAGQRRGLRRPERRPDRRYARRRLRRCLA